MTTEGHLTVRDYFDQVIFGRTAKREASSPAQVNAPGSGSFQRILTLSGNRRLHENHPKPTPTGLTVVDYLKNPVRVKCQFNYRMLAKAPEKDETKASISPGLPGDQSAETNTGTSSLKDSSPAPRASAPISSDNQSAANESLLIESSILQAARKYNLPPGLIKAVIRAESNFQVEAVSPAGAQGLMQLMPATAKALGVGNPFDIAENIDGGARYLRQMLDSFDGDVRVALAAYNAGPGTVEKYGGQIPPYQETQHYIDRVLRFSEQTV